MGLLEDDDNHHPRVDRRDKAGERRDVRVVDVPSVVARDLRRARLPGNAVALERRRVRDPVVDGRREHGDHGGGRLFGNHAADRDRRGAVLPIRIAPARYDVWPVQDAAVRYRRVGRRKLQRRDRQALPEADRAEIYGVPLREGTNDARGLRSQVHAGTRTEPERVEIRVQIRSAELARDEHRAGVLRAREDLRDGRRPVDLALRVAEGAPADDRVAHVLIARAGSDDALVESGRDGDGLQGRSGLVRPGDRAIAEGFGIRAPHAGGVVCG